jgi:hypothetical protein
MMEPTDTAPESALAPIPQYGVIRPIATGAEVLAAWEQFEAMKREVLTGEDYHQIQGKAFIKKSGWRKIAAAFGISDEVVKEARREIVPDKPSPDKPAPPPYFVWEVTARAIAPNGRYAEAVGSCASHERRFAHTEHDTRSTAHTRAKNRAISDLVGGGQVSAEEMDGLHAEPAPRLQPSRTAPAREADFTELAEQHAATVAKPATPRRYRPNAKLLGVGYRQPSDMAEKAAYAMAEGHLKLSRAEVIQLIGGTIDEWCQRNDASVSELTEALARLKDTGEAVPGTEVKVAF